MNHKVLVVDDSALVRKQLGSFLDKAGYDVGFAKHGQDAVEFVKMVDFDAITMDINMPIMDGLSALKEIMRIKPTPVIMVSSLTQDEADITFEALDFGAIDYIPKPGTFSVDIKTQESAILDKIAMACSVPKNRLRIRKQAIKKRTQLLHPPKQTTTQPLSSDKTDGAVLLGASTGGPGLIEEILYSLPSYYPLPVCIVQHMPETFTASFATRLNKNSKIEVLEAVAGQPLEPGKAYIAKGGWHLHFGKKSSGIITTKLATNNAKRFFVPSVDEMFFSALHVMNPQKILAVLLTGIGDDGADGMVALRQKGAFTIGENEQSAVVYGMPKEAFIRGGVSKQLPFDAIIKEILHFGGV